MSETFKFKISTCPVCGKSEVEEWDICEICFWQSDPIQNADPDYAGGANDESLNEYRRIWRDKHAK